MEKIKKIFSEIYDKYVSKIYRFVFVKVNSAEIAEDITSETFLRFFEALKSKNEIQNHQAFLYQIARNLIADYYRGKVKLNVVSAENSLVVDPSINAEQKAFLTSDIDTIKAALAGIKDDYQNVIIWRYLDEMSIPEVAKLMGKSEPATRVLIHRAMNSLREKLENKRKTA